MVSQIGAKLEEALPPEAPVFSAAELREVSSLASWLEVVVSTVAPATRLEEAASPVTGLEEAESSAESSAMRFEGAVSSSAAEVEEALSPAEIGEASESDRTVAYPVAGVEFSATGHAMLLPCH